MIESNNPSAVRSKTEITQALLKLMEEYPYSEITVKQIILTASLARKTFYRNFESKDDVLCSLIKKSFREYFDIVNNARGDVLTTIFSYAEKNRDILIARTGGTIGKTYIVRNLNENAVFASYLIRAIPLQLVNEEYLKLFMESPLYWEQLKAYSMGTGQPNVNGQSLSKLRLPLPPLNEQQRIVEYYKNILPKIKALK